MDEQRAIGLIGGTFDPIHYGHLMIAAAALEEFHLSEVIFIPSAIPPHKQDQQISSFEMRYEMTLIATLDNPHFLVSRVELERAGPSYTIDTIIYFQQVYPESQIYFITGADTILEINSWRSQEELLQAVKFITISRPGYSLAGLDKEFSPKHLERIFCLEVPGIGISSTDIRRRVQKKKSVKYYLPPAVEAYIEKKQLYR